MKLARWFRRGGASEMAAMGKASPLELTVAVVESIDGGYLAYVRELPGCIAQGESTEEALDNIVDVTRAFVQAILEEAGSDGATVVGKIVEERKYEVKPLELVPQ